MINKIKQPLIKKLQTNSQVREYFNSIKVFGSAITDKCRDDSDLDLFVELKPQYIKDANNAYNLILSIVCEADILFKHEQENCYKKLLDNMNNGIEILE